MEKIRYRNVIVGIIIRRIPSGSVPITDGKEPLQFVTLKHPKGKYLLAHAHAPKRRVTLRLQECLIVRKGRIRVDLYGPNKKKFRKIILKEGDSFILQDGGYGIHMLQDSEVIEVKNGPFIEDKVLL